ncbi:MAG TPA: hypothetical protein DEQ02_00960 [Ruminococcaceae bacterium]|nr:hypothetical protein [Oscillospiraceae bacterium]
MEQFQEFITENPMIFVAAVAGIAVLIIIIRIIVVIAGKKKKKEVLSKGDAASFVFNESIFPASRTVFGGQGLSGYKIIAVNGAEPNIVGGDLMVPAGHVVLEFQYIISTVNSHQTNRFPQQRVELDTQPGKRYKIDFNIMTNETTWKPL